MDDDVKENMRLMAEWNRPHKELEEVTPEVTKEEDIEVAVINEAFEKEGNLSQAVESIKVLEEDLSVKEDLFKKMKSELDTAGKLANVATAS